MDLVIPGLVLVLVGILILESARRGLISPVPFVTKDNGYVVGMAVVIIGFLLSGLAFLAVIMVVILAWKVSRQMR